MPILTPELIQRAVPPAPSGPAAPAPDEVRLRAEMTVFLHGRDPKKGLWVFAHGAAMWDHAGAAPDIVAPARLPGLARRYGLRDVGDRGTPERPGLTFGLEPVPALACPGLLLHLPGPEVERRLWPIWRQEMAPGTQEPAWRDAVMQAGRDAGGAPVRALCFLSRTSAPGYAGNLPIGQVADTLTRASGPGGSAAAFLLSAASILRANGMRDALLESLEAEVARRLAAMAPPGGSTTPSGGTTAPTV